MKILYHSFYIGAGFQSRQELLLLVQVQCRLHILSFDEDTGNSAAKAGSSALYSFLHHTVHFLSHTGFLVSSLICHFLEKWRLLDIAFDEMWLQRIYHLLVPYPAHIAGLNHEPGA